MEEAQDVGSERRASPYLIGAREENKRDESFAEVHGGSWLGVREELVGGCGRVGFFMSQKLWPTIDPSYHHLVSWDTILGVTFLFWSWSYKMFTFTCNTEGISVPVENEL